MSAAVLAPPVSPRVLLVDDTPANLIALAAVLKPLGVPLVEARSGAEALERIELGGYAVVLLDVQMPEMDGFEAAARLRATEKGREVPIIFLTAIARDERYLKQGYQAGAADYITKPFDADILRARVKAFVDLFRQREGLREQEVRQRTRERDEAVRRLVAFERIATTALETDDVDVFFRQLLGVFMEAADSADSATILLREGDMLRVRASVGARERSESVPVGKGFAGEIAATGRPLLATRPWREGEAHTAWLRERGVRAVYGVPLVHDGDVVGVAHISSNEAHDFSDAEKRMLRAMAERAAWAVAQRTRREMFRGALVGAPAVITILRPPDHVVDFCNTAARTLYGGRDLAGRTAVELSTPPEIIAMLDRVLASGDTLSLTEYAMVADFRDTGIAEERFFDSTFQPMRDAAGRVEAVLCFSIDVTERVRARAQLEKVARERKELLQREQLARADAEVANRAKDDFLATVSHELRTPLNAILGWTVTARRQATTPALERALAIIERNARAQTRIIEDVLDISRIISGKLRLDVVAINVADAIAGAIETVRPGAEGKGIELATRVGDLGVVAGDADRIQQVVWNVLSNAIKFTPPGGKVTLEAERDPMHVVVRVTDTGQGIEPAFVPHLFEPFRQADGSTTRRHGGLGLGLAIVREIVQAHGGTIRAASEGLGKGATFTIELPVRAATGSRGHVRPEVLEREAEVRLDDLRVLVVDDDDDARQLLGEILGARGAKVTAAASARDALAAIREARPDVLVSDIGMPEMDGFALIQHVRRLPADQGGRTPAIALTAYTRAEDGRRAFASGFQLHLSKPIDPAFLVSAVANVAGIPLPRSGPVSTDA